MRTIALFLVAALLTLWGWFFIEVAPLDARRTHAVPVDESLEETTSAATLLNQGVELDRAGRPADALLYFERAREFRPQESTYQIAVERQRARLAKRGWMRLLVPATALTMLFAAFAFIRGVLHGVRDRIRMRRLRLTGENWFRIRPEDKDAALPLRFNGNLGKLLKRHPLTVVWSSARHGKHMKSKPPVDTEGSNAILKLDGKRLERLRRYPGEWKGFLYLGGREIGNATARVG